MRISDWSSDVCSSDLCATMAGAAASLAPVSCPMTIMSKAVGCIKKQRARSFYRAWIILCYRPVPAWRRSDHQQVKQEVLWNGCFCRSGAIPSFRSEEHTSELQSLMLISYAVFCLKKKNKRT